MESVIIKRALKNQFVLIAEIGVNYYDIALQEGILPLDAAKLMIKRAKEAGIHAVKFQTYKAETLAAKKSPYYWDLIEESTTSQYELFKKFDSFGREEYQQLKKYCDQLDIEFLSTAFDFEAADYLEELMEVYKISSSDLNNLPFVAYQSKKNKPMLLSVGASNEEEIDRTIEVIRKYNQQPLVLMHCVLEYPTSYEHANLNKIIALKKRYPDAMVGYSDHTRPFLGNDVLKAAYLKGACVIEKHFTLNKNLKGNDHYHAMDPEDAKNILSGIKFLDMIGGSYDLQCLDSELIARRNARRSIVALGDIPKGAVITEKMVTFKRPGTGITPDKLQMVIGKVAAVDIPDDTILMDSMLCR